jgi:hypothetical protein
MVSKYLRVAALAGNTNYSKVGNQGVPDIRFCVSDAESSLLF